MNKNLVAICFFMLAATIGLGAFGAHALKKLADIEAQQSFETAVRYQFYGTIILLIVAFRTEIKVRMVRVWIRVFGLGMVLFSGSIYGLVLGKIMHLDWRFLGPITPLGGAIMILSLTMLGIHFVRNPSE
ncbi:MAG: DUF423 domain-containing protein [Bacteroidota bacterium]